ncbi:hypothetical protein ACE1CI_32045 [Aerosakkonemataceae cyanobacterium BLCC-F50]|uniref:Uncharacterized protein n=1 Tax=Floridaenema flaviceps BLCC-F50 TaxID=3153642 RepID=A0ABV4Y1H1_9CYAN
MNQVLHTQFSSLLSFNENLWHRDRDRTESHLAPVKQSRSRGVFLSHQGWQKLVQAGVLHNEFGERFTYGQLSERSLLDERTISRLLSCEVKVDKNTLKTFFRAFNLSLEAGDFTSSKGRREEGYEDAGTGGDGDRETRRHGDAEIEKPNEIPHSFPFSRFLLLPSLQHPSTDDILTIRRVEFEQIIEELTQLKQRLREHDRLFRRLGLNETHITQHLGA